MKKLLSIAALAAITAAAVTPAHSGSFRNHHWKQQEKLKAEWAKAQKVGGYNSPFVAAANIAAGKATDKDITPGINHITDVPGRQGILIGTSSDEE